MHLSWPADERPTWRVRSHYQRPEVAEVCNRLEAAVDLEDVLRASGKVRQPSVTLDQLAVTVSVLVKAGHEREAALTALELIEAVCVTTDCWLLGDLLRQTMQPALQLQGCPSLEARHG